MDWIALSQRKPTEEDGDSVGEVLWLFFNKLDGTHESCVAKWNDDQWLEHSTHFARIKDIKLPQPPAPEMPERLEYVRVPDSEDVTPGMLGYRVREPAPFVFQHAHKRSEWNEVSVVCYRRVEPKPRIVFELVNEGRKREPLVGERYVAVFGDAIATCKTPDRIGARIILRCVEGEELLK